ncbi:hypothetical protein KBD33_02270 [Candidatus Gracilibacteria bacterium]|nr:hypothetical protein [Candidatus Gracilibacteria bacterium]
MSLTEFFEDPIVSGNLSMTQVSDGKEINDLALMETAKIRAQQVYSTLNLYCDLSKSLENE